MSQETPATHPTDTVIDRVKYLIRMSRMTQNAFAQRLGVDPGNMSKHLSGKLPITDGLLNRMVVEMGVSKQWLRTGCDVPFPKPTHALEITPEAIDAPQASHRSRGVPVYDIDVTAGFGELSRMFTTDRIMGEVALPQLPDNTRIVRVSGDSMEPRINDGGFVAIRELSSTRNIFWGQIYVVVLEDYRMVKVLRRHADSSKVILHSCNPEYDDMEVTRTDIQALYLVEAIINYKLLN